MDQCWEVPGARVLRRPRREESSPEQARLLRAMGVRSPEAKAVMSLLCRSAAVLGMLPRARVGRGRTRMVLYNTTLVVVVLVDTSSASHACWAYLTISQNRVLNHFFLSRQLYRSLGFRGRMKVSGNRPTSSGS